MNKNVNYGNWVPEKMLALCYVAAAVLGIAAYVTGPVLHLAIATSGSGRLATPCAVCLVYSAFTCTSVAGLFAAAAKARHVGKKSIKRLRSDHLGMGRRTARCSTISDEGAAAARRSAAPKASPRLKARRYGLPGCRVERCYKGSIAKPMRKRRVLPGRITFHKATVLPIWKSPG
ncbi:MAG: hypothetical protein ACLU77_18425 [Waltera sp.]